MNNNWVKREMKDAVEESALDTLNVIREAKVIGVAMASTPLDERTYQVNIETTLDIEGVRTEDVSTTSVRVKNTVCRRCSRQLGNYYESILQVRSMAKDLPEDRRNEALAMIMNHVDQVSATNRSLFITKVEQVPGGIDVYLSSIALGKALCKELSDSFCAESKEAAKLVGQTDDGQDMYRVTYLVRLPEYNVGDVVIFDDEYYKMLRMSSVGGKALYIKDFRERSIRRPDMVHVRVFCKASDLAEATVISRSVGEIQVLSPRDYSTVDLRVPEDSEIGDTVKVVDIDETYYFVP